MIRMQQLLVGRFHAGFVGEAERNPIEWPAATSMTSRAPSPTREALQDSNSSSPGPCHTSEASADLFFRCLDGCNGKPSPTASGTVPETEHINNKVFVFGIIGLKAPVTYPLPSHLHAGSRTSILPSSTHRPLMTVEAMHPKAFGITVPITCVIQHNNVKFPTPSVGCCHEAHYLKKARVCSCTAQSIRVPIHHKIPTAIF